MENRDDIIYATNSNGEEITILKVKEWIKKTDKAELSNLFYDRLYGRYIKPYEFDNIEFKKKYKNGFAIMTSCCLLIETYTSFVQPLFRDTNRKSEKCFGWFFNVINDFKPFSDGGLSSSEYLKINQRINNKGLPRDFYINVRCGILHNGETRNGWRIRRDGELFNSKTKKINATLFLESLHNQLLKHELELQSSDFDSVIWKTYIDRLNDIIQKS